jgi:purine nucleosidase
VAVGAAHEDPALEEGREGRLAEEGEGEVRQRAARDERDLARAAGSQPDDSLALGRGEDPMHATRSVASNPIVRYVADALRFYMEFHARYDGFYGAFIHDALAVAAALDPGLITTKAVTVDVELGGTLTTGETVTDWRGVWGRPPNVDVAIGADAEEFLRRFVERVGRLAAARAT